MSTVEKKKVAVLFGGRSSEHEISIITALQLIEAIDVTRYTVIPVYVDHRGKWFSGDALLDKNFYKKLLSNLEKVSEVILMPTPGDFSLTVIKNPKDGSPNRSKIPVDIYLPAFHGQYGEDGCIQGLFELANVPYTGCGVLSAAVSMNKFICKAALSAYGIPVLPGSLVTKEEFIADIKQVRSAVKATPGLEKFPLFVKPCNLGSSIGIGIATDDASLDSALANVFKYDLQALVEPCLTNRMEINVSVLGGDIATASVVEIPVSNSGALTYEDKYMRDGGKKGGASRGMASLTRVIDPQDLDPKHKQSVTDYALKSYKLLGCGGVVRFDFMLNTDTNKVVFNELNTLPGSFSFYLWASSKPKVLYTEMIDRLVSEGEAIYQQKISLQRDTGFRAMFK